MPKVSISLPANLAKRLNHVRGLIGVSQEALARDAHVAQGTVSTLLSGNSDKPVRANYARPVVLAVQQAVEKHIENTSADSDEADELRRPVAEALAFVEGRNEEHSHMALPGGAIPPDAKNRVVRTEIERKLERGLDGHPAMMRVDGPPQSGKSTLLRLVERWAIDRGLNVTYADRATRDHDDPAHFVECLARDMATAWGVPVPQKIASVKDLQDFVRAARRRSAREPAIAIIDDLADMPNATQHEIIRMCRVLQNEASHLNLSLLLALEPLPESGEANWFRSSKGYFHCVVPVASFSAHEIESLFTHYPNAGLTLDGRMNRFLGGQPYLTHLAVEQLSAGQTYDDIQAEAHIPWGPFDLHLQRLLQAIGGIPGASSTHPLEFDRLFLQDVNIFKPGPEPGVRPWTSDLYESFFESRIQVAS